jgi:3D (Asp-Asp-Asp) domain-containing protein
MKNLVRGGVILSLIGMFVVFIYAQTKTETALNIANDSQLKLNNNIENLEVVTEAVADDKKLVKKTVSKATVGAKAAASSAGTSKGSFIATAYCLKGRTAMGHGVRRGIIAADPRVLRLGSRVNLNAGAYSGQYLVSDTGGRIKGKKIDIWMSSCAEARRFGRRTVSVSSLAR